jgi:hypothetical protein
VIFNIPKGEDRIGQHSGKGNIPDHAVKRDYLSRTDDHADRGGYIEYYPDGKKDQDGLADRFFPALHKNGCRIRYQGQVDNGDPGYKDWFHFYFLRDKSTISSFILDKLISNPVLLIDDLNPRPLLLKGERVQGMRSRWINFVDLLSSIMIFPETP